MSIVIFLIVDYYITIRLNCRVCIPEIMGEAAKRPHPFDDIACRAPLAKSYKDRPFLQVLGGEGKN